MAALRAIGACIDNSRINTCWIESKQHGPSTVKQMLRGGDKSVKTGQTSANLLQDYWCNPLRENFHEETSIPCKGKVGTDSVSSQEGLGDESGERKDCGSGMGHSLSGHSQIYGPFLEQSRRDTHQAVVARCRRDFLRCHLYWDVLTRYWRLCVVPSTILAAMWGHIICHRQRRALSKDQAWPNRACPWAC